MACAGNTVMVWVMGNVKLLLEWLTVPLFIIALQLPQGAALYWLVSSLTALAQVLSPPSRPPPIPKHVFLHSPGDLIEGKQTKFCLCKFI